MIPRAAIVGYGGLVERELPDSLLDLFSLAGTSSISSAGIELDDIDGLVVSHPNSSIDEPTLRWLFPSQIAQYLGIKEPRYLDLVDIGGCSIVAGVMRASLAIEAGLARYVLCIQGGKGSLRRNQFIGSKSQFELLGKNNLDFRPTSEYAMITARHAYEFGTKDEDRAMISVNERKNAERNPDALFRKPISADDVLRSPVVCSPLHLLEMVMAADGAHAVVVCSSADADRLRGEKVSIVGYGESHDARPLEERDSILQSPARPSSKRALETANVTLSQVDAFELYDAYTTMVMLELEDIGLCERGESGDFVRNTDMTARGDVPVNTNGGSLNTGQPAFMSGGVLLTEAVRQLKGEAQDCQVPGVKTIFVNALGGTLQHSASLVLSTRQ